MAYLWSHQEIADELKNRLPYTNSELESTRNDEDIKHLLDLLNVATNGSDQPNDQLYRTLESLNKLIQFSKPTQIHPVLPDLQIENNPTLKPIQVNSSHNPSQTYNNYNYGSCHHPIGSIFEPVSYHQPFVQEFNGQSDELGFIQYSLGTSKSIDDQASVLIENLACKKPLPQKGRLLQAVMEAGPLLHTLLVAGNLPQWRNPPPPMLEVQIPPVSIIDYHYDHLESISQRLLETNSSYPYFDTFSSIYIP